LYRGVLVLPPISTAKRLPRSLLNHVSSVPAFRIGPHHQYAIRQNLVWELPLSLIMATGSCLLRQDREPRILKIVPLQTPI
jgi:hypothetical protein